MIKPNNNPGIKNMIVKEKKQQRMEKLNTLNYSMKLKFQNILQINQLEKMLIYFDELKTTKYIINKSLDNKTFLY